MGKKPFHSLSLMTSVILIAFTCLACSLAASKAHALAAWIGSWDYVLRHDQDGKLQAAFARLQGDNESLLWLTCYRYSVGEEKPESVSVAAAISQKSYLGDSSIRGRSTIYWFDGGSPELGFWMYRGRVGQISDREQVTRFLDKLEAAQTLVVELTDYRMDPQRSEFQLNANDTKALADKFRQDCRDISGLAGKVATWIR
jgi:hypothetical protein